MVDVERERERERVLNNIQQTSITSADDIGMSVTSGATAPAPPNLLMLNTCKKINHIGIREQKHV